MKTVILSVLSLTLVFGISSCKKQTSSGVGSSLTYQSSNNFTINPNLSSADPLKSIVNLENIDFLCDIEKNRVEQNTYNEGYELTESFISPISILSFKMVERNALPEHETLGSFLDQSVLEIYHGDEEDIMTLGTCSSVAEIGLSFDQLTFDIDQKAIDTYVKAHPDYKFRVVNTFNKALDEPRFFTYELDVFYSADFIYTEQ